MRPIRPWVVVAGCLLASLAAVTAVVWNQGGLLRESAANYLRERLAVEFGAQFQTTDLRGTWFPPGLSLGRVTLDRPGESLVLTADDVKISFNPYAVLFGRERLGRVVVVRPRLFVRPGPGAALVVPPPGPAESPAPAATARPGARVTPKEVAARLRSFLRPPFPLRVFEVVDGRIEISGAAGRSVHASGIDLSILVSSGSARAVLDVGSLAVGTAGRQIDLGALDADVTIEEGRLTVRELVAGGGALTGTLRGTVGATGALALKGELSSRLETIAALLGRPVAVAGVAHFEGEITGTWRDPAASGSLAVRDLVAGGHRWPQARGQIAWGDGRLSWSRLRLPVGEGEVSSAGEVDFSGGALRYRVEAEARSSTLPG